MLIMCFCGNLHVLHHLIGLVHKLWHMLKIHHRAVFAQSFSLNLDIFHLIRICNTVLKFAAFGFSNLRLGGKINWSDVITQLRAIRRISLTIVP